MECLFGTSPQSVAESPLRGRLGEEESLKHEISLGSFIDQLPYVIEKSKKLVSQGLIAYGSGQDPIIQLFQ
jgi:hypothetical protein